MILKNYYFFTFLIYLSLNANQEMFRNNLNICIFLRIKTIYIAFIKSYNFKILGGRIVRMGYFHDIQYLLI